MIPGVVASSIAAAGGGAAGYLNGIAVAPRLALGLKKLVSTATVALRVRRSSDNAEQDIGFSGNALDTAALAAFVGSSSAYVPKLYDQNGNGFDGVQAIASKQARIVNAGTYDGKLVFDGVDDCYVIAGLPFGTPQLQVYSKVQMSTSAGVHQLFETGARADIGGPGTMIVFQYDAFGGWTVDCYNNGSGTDRGYVYPNDGSMAVMSFLVDRSQTGDGEFVVRKDSASLGVLSKLIQVEQTGNFAANDLNIGSRDQSSSFAPMNLASFVLYDASSNAYQDAIEAVLSA